MQQHQSLQTPDNFQSGGMQSSDMNHRVAMSEAMRVNQGFSPFELQSRSSFASDDPRDLGNYVSNHDALRRTAVPSPAERPQFSGASDTASNYSNMGHVSANSDSFSVNGQGQPFDPIGGANNSSQQFATGKGSRFLKYFEEKGREGGQVPGVSIGGGIRKPSGPGFQSSSPAPGQRPEQGGFNGGHTDNRTVDELFAMLNNSSQVRFFMLICFEFFF